MEIMGLSPVCLLVCLHTDTPSAAASQHHQHHQVQWSKTYCVCVREREGGREGGVVAVGQMKGGGGGGKRERERERGLARWRDLCRSLCSVRHAQERHHQQQQQQQHHHHRCSAFPPWLSGAHSPRGEGREAEKKSGATETQWGHSTAHSTVSEQITPTHQHLRHSHNFTSRSDLSSAARAGAFQHGDCAKKQALRCEIYRGKQKRERACVSACVCVCVYARQKVAIPLYLLRVISILCSAV